MTRNASSMDRTPGFIENRDLEPADVRREPSAPDHRADTGVVEIELRQAALGNLRAGRDIGRVELAPGASTSCPSIYASMFFLNPSENASANAM